jgi:deazaflavin-dependent oxidoreductase (nitroreductase family)
VKEGSTVPEPTARQFSAVEERILDVASKIMSRVNTWLFRLSGGRIGNKFLHGAPVFLLITKGRKSGERRTSPLIYVEDGACMAVVASKGGSARHPLWYLNLKADPDVEVEIGSVTRTMHARDATAEEKARLWPRLTAIYPPYDAYQARTARAIPVVILAPR